MNNSNSSNRTFLNDKLAWKTFLSSLARDVTEVNGICSWSINKKPQIAFTRPLEESDLEYLLKFDVFNSYYITDKDVDILKGIYKVKKSKENSVITPIKDFNLSGNNFTKIRTAVNKNSKRSFEILDTYKTYDDFFKFTVRWDETCGNKHFQSRIGKNRWFYKQRYHEDGISVFVYDGDILIGYGTLSKPDESKISSYVAGKTLCYDYKGISEYVDVLLYEKGMRLGIEKVNTGGGKDTVVNFKMKYPNSYMEEAFDVHCEKLLKPVNAVNLTTQPQELKGLKIDNSDFEDFFNAV